MKLKDERGEIFEVTPYAEEPWLASGSSGEVWHLVGPPTNLSGERWDNGEGETAWRFEEGEE